jgi:REP element-mobilizing transposase RayT
VSGGVYYINLQSNPGRHIFSHAGDYGTFERFLTSALASCRATVHAFAWQPDTVHLVVQITDIPLGRFIQRLTSQYARSVHKQRGGTGHLFKQRYRALLIDPEVYLSRLIRYVHLRPPAEGATDGVESNRLTSHDAYLGITRIPWLTKAPALRDGAYSDFMKMPPDPDDASCFEHGSKWEPRARCGKLFLANALARPGVPENRGTIDQIIDEISLKMGLERQAVTSKSRHRKLALARALVAWHSIDRNIGTLAEVSRKLHRDPSTLSVAISRYRKLRPELFDNVAPESLQGGPLSPDGRTQAI